MSEFDLIRRHFAGLGARRADVVLGIGDDCAVLAVPPGRQLLVSIDTLVGGRHFAAGTDPEALGHKVLAVNLSDLAAMGAEPAWVTLAATLPTRDDAFLAAFTRGFDRLARRHGVQLVGGDTTSGPLSFTVQAHGLVEDGQALRRDGASPGDLVYVTGTPGDAGLALLAGRSGLSPDVDLSVPLQRLLRPEPRVAEGRGLLGLASAMVDVSDGLAADLGHVAERSGVAIVIERARLPLSAAVRAHIDAGGNPDLPLAAGDDYELAFTLPVSATSRLAAVARDWATPVTRIGTVTTGTGVRIREGDGAQRPAPQGYDHFHA